ncbi:hypothetical protein RU639_002225 [Aspergillus parasiticus]
MTQSGTLRPMLKQEAASRFVIGSTTERSFCAEERQEQDVRGPWGTAEEYLTAVARREISLIQNSATHKPKDAPAAARFPSVFDCDDLYPWGAVQPELPDNFDTLSPTEKELAREAHDRLRLKKVYELASRKFNPLLVKAMDAMQNDDDPTSYIFYLVGQSSSDGLVPLGELLVQIYDNWDQIAKKQGLTMQCPISFTEEKTREGRRQGEEWAVPFNEYENLRAQLLGKDGWVSNEEYNEAMQIYQSHKDDLEALRQRLEQLSQLLLC